MPRRRGDAAATDWVEIAALYRELARMVPSPVVELNRAVAVGMADGPEAGTAAGRRARRAPARSPVTTCFPRPRADLLRRLGRHAEAAVRIASRVALAETDAERRYLAHRLAELRGRVTGGRADGLRLRATGRSVR